MAQNTLPELKALLKTPNVAKRFEEMLGKKSTGFITSLTSVVQNNDLLAKAEPQSVVLAASAAAALDLPINPNLGLAAIIPFNDTKNHRCLAQMQIMRDGWVELAQRTGQVVAIANEEVYEGELVSGNRFTGIYEFDETCRVSDKVIGYMAYIKLANGFEKTVYWTAEQCKKHALRYSQTYKKGYGLWKDNFDAMAKKTVLKHLIKKYVPKSIEIISAVEFDQATVSGSIDKPTIEYHDGNEGNDLQDADATEIQEVQEDVPEAKAEGDNNTKQETKTGGKKVSEETTEDSDF